MTQFVNGNFSGGVNNTTDGDPTGWQINEFAPDNIVAEQGVLFFYYTQSGGSEWASQTLTGLTVGQKYAVNFRLSGYSSSINQFSVRLGGPAGPVLEPVFSNGIKSMEFTATSSSQTITFVESSFGPTFQSDVDRYWIDDVNLTVICFGRGTLIATEAGEVPVEGLRVGDMVETIDHGLQPLRWIGSRQLSARELTANPGLRPIRILAGSLGVGLPLADLLVSPQHRMLVSSAIAERMFGTREVLIPAKKLLGVEGVEVADEITEVEYWHFLFDTHELVYANGAPSESLLTGPEALKAVSPESREEIISLFPDIVDEGLTPQPARHIPIKGRTSKALVARHQKNRKALIE